MTAPVQKTKLFIPRIQPGLVERTRLLSDLDELCAEGRRVVLISSPAGSGKTTLVVQWLEHLDWPAAWLSLDAQDNSPPRFFTHLIAALQEVVPGVGEIALPLLELPGVQPGELIDLLSNDLAETDDSFVLVLDDLHTIENPRLHEAVQRLIEAQPPRMRLVLLTRQDPLMQLALRRARGELLELRQADLRFTLAEAVDFFNRRMKRSLTTEQVERLETRTEGWVAGLQMASLSLQHAENIEQFLQDFSGTHRYILDFLVEEVLANLPEEIQHFLLETSILEQMCGSLCAAVTGRSEQDAQALLENLSGANLFLIPLDEQRCWYRYHHLFRDLLQARLRSAASGSMRALSLKASGWYETHVDHRLAVEYALQANEMNRAADLVDRYISEHWKTVDIEFHLLINRLPEKVIHERPTLCLQRAWLHVILGQTDRVLADVEASERFLLNIDTFPDVVKTGLLAFARTLRAYLQDIQNQPVDTSLSLEEALQGIPKGNTGMRNSVDVVIGTIYFMEGDFAAALRCFERAYQHDIQVNGTNAVPITSARMALVFLAQGRLREAERRLLQAEAYMRERGIRRYYISGVVPIMLGELYLEWNRLDEAEARIREGLRLLDDWPNPSSASLGLSLLARLYIAHGDQAGATEALQKADAIRERTQLHPIFLKAIEAAQVHLLASQPDYLALQAWLQEIVVHTPSENSFRYEAHQIHLCRAFIALGEGQKTVPILERLAEDAKDRRGSRVTILALLAAANRSKPSAAAANLEEALHLAEPEGYVRTFLNLGEPMAQVLYSWLQHTPEGVDQRLQSYARRLLGAYQKPSSASPWIDLPEPLTPREVDVLRLVAQGLTNQQIADRLVVSIRTVKKHVQNIHGKLGVQNRTQAAARAKELKILE